MIPKKIHYCWIGEKSLPESAQRCIASWKKYCPDYQIIEWNEKNYDFQKAPFMKEAYSEKKWGFVPDYARLDIIYHYGGIYLDTDVELVKTLDGLLGYEGYIGFEDERYINLGQGFGAERGHPLIKALLDSFEGRHFKKPDGSLDLLPSPNTDSDLLEKQGLIRNGKQQMIGNFIILPSDYLCPKNFYDGIIRKTDNTISIHHFDGSWLPKQTQKDVQRKRKYKQLRLKMLPLFDAATGTLRFLLGKRYDKFRTTMKNKLRV